MNQEPRTDRGRLPRSVSQYVLASPARTTLGRFTEGFGATGQGWRYLMANPTLWRYALVPIALNLLIATVALITMVWFAYQVFTAIHSGWVSDLPAWLKWIATAGEVVLGLILLLICLAGTMVIWFVGSNLICGYFYGVLAEKTEHLLGTPPEQLRPTSLKAELLDTILSVTVLIVANVGLLLLNVIPLLGGLVALILSFLIGWSVLGIDFLGYPLYLRGMRRMSQYDYGRAHFPQTLGLGASVFLMEFIPIVGAFFMTIAVIGAVLLRHRIEKDLPGLTLPPLPSRP